MNRYPILEFYLKIGAYGVGRHIVDGHLNLSRFDRNGSFTVEF